MTRLVVIGSGAMGLAAAWEAARAGHDVTLLEAGNVAGGMAAHFDFDGLSIERFYHFICTTDFATFKLLGELGIADSLRWRATTMGHFSGGRLHEWGNPVALLRYPGMSLWARLRYGVLAFVSTRRDRWDALETQSAREWITRWGGTEVYDKMWKPLFDLKFYDYADPISAAWIWTRVKRIGRSRKSLFEEKLGYLEGGSETLVTALADGFAKAGGKLRLSTPALRVETERRPRHRRRDARRHHRRRCGHFDDADAAGSPSWCPTCPRIGRRAMTPSPTSACAA
jgi:protoporphyrinogen oxidase